MSASKAMVKAGNPLDNLQLQQISTNQHIFFIQRSQVSTECK